MNSYVCRVCDFDVWHPVAQLSVSVLGLYDDSRWPYRSILVLKNHHEHLDELDLDLANRFFLDLSIAGRAIREESRSLRVNYAILGNEVAHVHAHLIPRGAGPEMVPNRPPWEDPRPVGSLGIERLTECIAGMQRRLNGLLVGTEAMDISL